MTASIAPEREPVRFDRHPAGTNASPATPPGWYSDPSDARRKRYWDGASWQNMVVPASGLPDLPRTGRPVTYATRPVYDITPIPHRLHHWTPARIVSLVAVVLVGGTGWTAVAAGIADLATGGAVSVLVVGSIGIAVLIGWTLVMVTLYADQTHYVRHAPRRAWRIVALAWLTALLVAILHLMAG